MGWPKQLNRAALHRCLLLFPRRSPFSEIIPIEIADEGLDSIVFGEKTTMQRQFRRPLLPLYLPPQRRPTVSSSPFSPFTGLSTLQEVSQPHTHTHKKIPAEKKNQAPKVWNKQKQKNKKGIGERFKLEQPCGDLKVTLPQGVISTKTIR